MPLASDRLPYVDEHSTIVEADPDATWQALARVAARSFGSARATRFVRLLGCADLESSGPRPLAPGSAFPGFHVEAAKPGGELALAGAHRFADYALIFHLDDLGDGRTRLRAETRAEFPGIKGRIYRTLVIGTRAHVLVTRRLLGAVQRRA